MIQDLGTAVFDNHYEEKSISDDAMLMFVRGEQVLYKVEDNKMIYPKCSECDIEGIDVRYMFSIDDVEYFLAFEDVYIDEDEEADTPYRRLLAKLVADGFEFKNRMYIRNVYLNNPDEKKACYAGVTAYQLGAWYEDNRICGRCGSVLSHSKEERMMYCDKCGNRIYPKICPAVIVGVTDNDKLLLTKYSTGHKRLALVAGFAEVGETIEETVKREVMEEVGLKVKNIRYYKSQPWTFTDTLLFGFFCDVDKDRHITMDEKELSYANWIPRKKLEEVEDDGISLTREMIRVFKEGRERNDRF